MINYVSGDILKSKAEALAHGVAPNDDFKQGLALSLRKQWPSLYKDFRHYCKTTHPKEGTLWSWKGVGGPVIVNLMTQMHPPSKDARPGKATLPNINHSLKELAKTVTDEGYQSLAITKVATGVGGRSWDKVKPLIEQHLGDLKIPVYVYETFQAGVEATEQ